MTAPVMDKWVVTASAMVAGLVASVGIDGAFAIGLAAQLVGAPHLWYIVVMEQVAPPTCLFAQA